MNTKSIFFLKKKKWRVGLKIELMSQAKKNITIQIRSKLKKKNFPVTAEKYKRTIWDNYQLSETKVDNLQNEEKKGATYTQSS